MGRVRGWRGRWGSRAFRRTSLIQRMALACELAGGSTKVLLVEDSGNTRMDDRAVPTSRQKRSSDGRARSALSSRALCRRLRRSRFRRYYCSGGSLSMRSMASSEGAASVAASTVLSLCSGGGGLDLGLRLAVPDARTICYVENEVTAAAVLVKNMETGGLDDAPLWTDLRSFDAAAWRGVVDIVIGGYPCQPFSNAGKRLGADDPRHLWPEVERIVRDVQPEWCFFENVGAHLRLGFYEVARSLQDLGYTVAAGLFTASEVGAPHGRERLFILAHRASVVQREPQHTASAESWCDARQNAGGRGVSVVGHANLTRLEGRRITVDGGADEWLAWPPGPSDSDAWGRVLACRPDLAPAIESPVRGVADGLAGWMGRADQLHILGNGVVPQQAAYALRMLMVDQKRD